VQGRAKVEETRKQRGQGHYKSRSPALDPGPVCGTAYAGFDLMDLAEDEDFLVEVPVDGVGVVDEVPQDLGVVGGGHD
jgi:hypothetical protein